ncbi:DUF6228 family protein [Kribbella sp. CA-247076]|uniref:DUF6228 family protein n=1 Tax=Kribbella sp. CA-247076 TaxID=3239941 RepID=UPI003D92419B
MTVVVIGSGDEYLRLTAVEWPGEPETPRLFLQAELRVPGESPVEGVSAARVVIPHAGDVETLVGFFDEVAERWRDLEPDERPVWRSFLREVEVEARRVRPAGSPQHRGPDYVALLVTLRDVRAWESARWIVTATLSVQPAGQLHDIATDVHALAGALG